MGRTAYSEILWSPMHRAAAAAAEHYVCRGRAGREESRITVSDGSPSVTETDEKPQIVPEHKEAELFFFGLVSSAGTSCPSAVWCPPPIGFDFRGSIFCMIKPFRMILIRAAFPVLPAVIIFRSVRDGPG